MVQDHRSMQYDGEEASHGTGRRKTYTSKISTDYNNVHDLRPKHLKKRLHESDASHNRTKTKDHHSHNVEVQKLDKDYKKMEKIDSGLKKGYGSSEQLTSSRRRWDETDDNTYSDKSDIRSVKSCDAKRKSSIERSGYVRNEHGESKTKVVDPSSDKVVKSNSRKDTSSDSERCKSKRNRPKVLDLGCENIKLGKYDTCNNRNKNWESSKETSKMRQPNSIGRDSKGNDSVLDHNRDLELPYVKTGGRKAKVRGEAVKATSMFGISNSNYDVIEIQPNNHGKTESASNLVKRTEANQQYNAKSGANDEEWVYRQEESSRRSDSSGSGLLSEDMKERYSDVVRDVLGGRGRGQQGVVSGSSIGGRIRPTGRDNLQVGIQLPMMGSPYEPLGLPLPRPMQPIIHSMSPAPGPLMPPRVFISPFPPAVLPIMGVPSTFSPLMPGPLGPRFSAPNIRNSPNPAMYYNQSGPVRGIPPCIVSPGFNPIGPMTRGTPPEKAQGGRIPPESGTLGKAPTRGEQCDYSQNFVDTGMRPQNFIRKHELAGVVEDYPKLRELITKKDEIVTKSASAPMYYKCDLKEFELSPKFFGTKFDVILVDPPWEEYVHRAPGVAKHMGYWTFEEIMNLKIEAIADMPSFIFLWVGDGVGLEQGRQCLKKWGFGRCEDICWIKTNKSNAIPGLRHDSHTLFQHSKEHCLMGIKGTVRRSNQDHIIHANIDTDIIIAEEPPCGSTQKPEDMYRIIEHFALGRRRIELFGEDHNIRPGWLTVGKNLSSSNFNKEGYIKSFADKDGKVWQGGGGRYPPPGAPHLVVTTPDIEALRPKSPMKNQQQMQQQQQQEQERQSVAITLTTPSVSNRRAAGNSSQNLSALGVNQDTSTPAPLGEGVKGSEGSALVP